VHNSTQKKIVFGHNSSFSQKEMDRRAERAEEVPGQHQYNSGHNQTHLDWAIGHQGKK
jgi:hypothetical protein